MINQSLYVHTQKPTGLLSLVAQTTVGLGVVSEPSAATYLSVLWVNLHT